MTYQPLRVLLIELQRNAVQQMDRSIAASRTYYCFNRVVLECPYDVGSTFIGCAGIHIHVEAVGMRADNGMKSPGLYHFCCLENRLLWYPIGRRYKGYPITLF